MEVIEAIGSASSGLVGVRILEDSIYLSWRGRTELEASISKGLTVRNEKLGLHDVSMGTVVLAMSAIPHSASEATLVRLLSQFGPVIGEFHLNEHLARLTLPRSSSFALHESVRVPQSDSTPTPPHPC